MKYYVVHLPLWLNKELVYKSPVEIAEGARVLVRLSAKAYPGICGQEYLASPDEKISYKLIDEVLDAQSIVPHELIELAKWMAKYYMCSTGKALFSMIPALMMPELDAVVQWTGNNAEPRFDKLKAALIEGEAVKLSDLKKQLPAYPVYAISYEAEAMGLVSIERKVKQRDKPKYVNYITRKDTDFDINSLPLKQREAWELIINEPISFPMASISHVVSYSAIKALGQKGFIAIEPRKVDPETLLFDGEPSRKIISLNSDQQIAISSIAEQYDKFNVNLLFGVTGSGKTEVYLEIIRRYVKLGRSVIFLIPEIALTPQMVDRFRADFGDILAIQHSQLTDKDRFMQWQKIKKGDKRVIIGARSAVFAPVVDLGLIVIDEEHEGSYKQDSVPRYHGRDIAVVRAKLCGAQVVIGSATPSLESWQNAKSGKYRMQTMLSRPLDFQLPEVKIVDLRDEYEQELISPTLLEAIDKRLSNKEQVILFQNRRGHSSFVQCMKCGKLIVCKNCEISMAYHRDREEMQCHYCGLFYPSPRKCPECGSYSFSYGAPGTQKLEQTIKILFPDARVMRMDSDSARKKDTYKTMYNRMKNGEVDILLGTQMISKGLDFPDVTLVGIIMADISLNVPDYRAAERCFQLITQVAGRAGRGEKAGEVIVQTYNPEHYAIQAASKQDYLSFVTEELEHRKTLYYPPYYRLARIVFTCSDLSLLKLEMRKIEQIKLEMVSKFRLAEILIVGPSEAPLNKINNQHRYHMIIKARNHELMRRALEMFEASYKTESYITHYIDVDPASLM